MVLSIGGGTATTKYKGIFINKARVKAVTDLSHQTLPNIGKAFDLAIKVTLDIGKSFDKEVTIFGNFKRSSESKVESLGSAFKVSKFFECFGIKGELTPSNDLPAEWISRPIGKECFVLDYKVGVKENGKDKYYAWDILGNDPDILVRDFLKGVAKGFPRNFDPDAISSTFGDAYEGPTSAETMEEMSF